MKKVLALLFSLILIAAFGLVTGCEKTTVEKSTEKSTTVTPVPAPAPEKETVKEKEIQKEVVPVPVPVPEKKD